jgi:hypothetical protein
VLIEYLDFVSQADSLAPHWSPAELDSFGKLLRHKREDLDVLPFVAQQRELKNRMDQDAELDPGEEHYG